MNGRKLQKENVLIMTVSMEFIEKYHEFVLSNWKNNFLGEIPQKLILSYFEHNKISWWGEKANGNILSSQTCLNYLFVIRTTEMLFKSCADNIHRFN